MRWIAPCKGCSWGMVVVVFWSIKGTRTGYHQVRLGGGERSEPPARVCLS